jgi:hypothetical protein
LDRILGEQGWGIRRAQAQDADHTDMRGKSCEGNGCGILHAAQSHAGNPWWVKFRARGDQLKDEEEVILGLFAIEVRLRKGGERSSCRREWRVRPGHFKPVLAFYLPAKAENEEEVLSFGWCSQQQLT